MTDNKNDNDNIDHDDGYWVESIRKGDEKVFELLFKKYFLQLTRFSWRYIDSKAIAEELVQELFTKLWEERENWTLNNDNTVRAYLYKSVRNMSLNHIKHLKIRDKYDAEWMNKKETPKIEFDDKMREEQIKQAVNQAIEDLPPRSRMAYKLHRFDGLTYPEIAEIMDVSVKTVESQMTRALKKLRERLSYLLPLMMFTVLIA